MKNLPHPDKRHLEAAEGWLGLGCFKEADEELTHLAAEYRAHPYVLEMCYKIYSESGKWEMAAETAQSLTEALPKNQWGYFYKAYALHELKRTREAYDTLKAVIRKFPKHQTMHFNLACYSCVLGDLKEAMQWLKKAINLPGEKNIREFALKDRDLEPLWKEIGEM